MPRPKRLKSPRASPTSKHDTARYIQFLRIAPNNQVTRSIISAAPAPVIKVLSNAALNAHRGKVSLGPKELHEFSKHRPLFKTLSDRRVNLELKRDALLNQRGGAFPLIPLLIGAVVASLGSTFLSGRVHDIGK